MRMSGMMPCVSPLQCFSTRLATSSLISLVKTPKISSSTGCIRALFASLAMSSCTDLWHRQSAPSIFEHATPTPYSSTTPFFFPSRTKGRPTNGLSSAMGSPM